MFVNGPEIDVGTCRIKSPMGHSAQSKANGRLSIVREYNRRKRVLTVFLGLPETSSPRTLDFGIHLTSSTVPNSLPTL